jgi:predicted glycosyltransferase involved in capsule biosynthesis
MTYTDQTLQKSKFNLTDTSFIIHFRRDSDDRVFNLRCILDYFHKFIDYGELFIINDDSEKDPELDNIFKEYPNVSLVFFKNDGVYRRTLCFNKIANIATKKILCFYDTDALVKPEYLFRAQHGILTGAIDHVYPYNGLFVDVKKIKRETLANFQFEELENLLTSRHIGYDNEYLNVIHNNSVGGIVMISKSAFQKMNGYNTEFIGWGCEDVEIEKRSRTQNNVSRIANDDAICWHLQHDNTIRTENIHYQNNVNILYSR